MANNRYSESTRNVIPENLRMHVPYNAAIVEVDENDEETLSN